MMEVDDQSPLFLIVFFFNESEWNGMETFKHLLCFLQQQKKDIMEYKLTKSHVPPIILQTISTVILYNICCF